MKEIDFIVKKPLTIFEGALSRVPVLFEYKDFLKNTYLSYGRYYHGIYHLAQMVHMHQQLKEILNLDFSYNDEMILYSAIMYHDVVYDALRNDNELQSANLWIKHRKNSGKYLGSEAETKIIESFIQLTANHFLDRPFDENNHLDILREWFIGLDLVSLALPYPMFKSNSSAIRNEYSHLTDQEWNSGRGKFLENVNKIPKIFLHPVMYDLFETKARDNIKIVLQ
jgi:predicted metal-dependent HD superfamily phosphohydrolase